MYFDISALQKDCRIPTHSGYIWSVVADVESLAWDPHNKHSFVVSDLPFYLKLSCCWCFQLFFGLSFEEAKYIYV